MAIDVAVDVLAAPGISIAVGLYQAVCNLIEVLIAAWFLAPAFSSGRCLTRAGQLVRLLGYGAILAPGVASLLAGFRASGPFGASESFAMPSALTFAFWFTGDALGIAIVTPLYLRLQKRPRFSRRTWQEVAALFLVLCGVTACVFWQTTLPLFFLILPFLLLVEVRLGLAGSALGLLAVSVIGGYLTPRGHGPVALTHLGSMSSRTFTLQFFVFVCMIVLYIVEIALAKGHEFELNLRASEQRFRILAEGSHDIIVLYNLRREIEYASPAILTMLGWDVETFRTPEFWNTHAFIHPDDVTGRENLFAACLAGHETNTLDYRCLTRDGRYLWLEVQLALYRNTETGAPAGFIHISRDISSRKAAEEELNEALTRAEGRVNIDAMTGIANRGGFDEFMASEWAHAIRSQASISLLMIDVDHFKQFNDLYGHIAGDTCLREVSTTLLKALQRATDRLARYGGEEFAVVLPETDAAGARAIAEELRRAVALRRIPHGGNPHEVVTISIGCAAEVPEIGAVPTALIKTADYALYRAKSAGRNRIA